jgi:hypothetical protein
MKNWMVEVAISLTVCVVEAVMALCCLHGFLLEGFILSGLVGRLLTVFVTTPGRVRCYGVVVYISHHLSATVYLFTWS